jgi:hypothetical protein
MLVWNDVVFVFWIQRLKMRWDVDLFGCELRHVRMCERFEEIGVVREVEVQVGGG